MVPVDLEDARLVLDAGELDAHPAMAEWARAVSSAMHGQASHGIRGRVLRPAEQVAAERVERDRREAAQRRRLDALRRGSCADRAAADNEWPF